MRYALFTALPYVGHLNPLLRQAEELRRRGWRTAVAATSEMLAHIERESPGMAVVDLGPLGGIMADLRQAEAAACADPDYRRGGLRFMPLLARLWPVMFDGLVTALAHDRPDVLVVDIFTWAGLAAGEHARVPIVINNPSLLTGVPLELMPPAPHVPFATTGQSIKDIGRLQRAAEPLIRYAFMMGIRLTVGRQHAALRRSRGLAGVAIHELLRHPPIMVNGAFGLEYRRPLPPNVEMVGPMLPEDVPSQPSDLDDWLTDGPPVIYANLGTVSLASASQLANMAGALTSEDRRALWVLKPAQAARLPGPVPAGVRIVDWVPSPRAVLAHPNVPVFVSHCGMNSVHESLSAGTPIVGIPMLADQLDMAARVADAGVGLRLDKQRFTSESLRQAIDRVWHDPSFRHAIPPIQQAFAQAGGVPRAADLIAREVPP